MFYVIGICLIVFLVVCYSSIIIKLSNKNRKKKWGKKTCH